MYKRGHIVEFKVKEDSEWIMGVVSEDFGYDHYNDVCVYTSALVRNGSIELLDNACEYLVDQSRVRHIDASRYIPSKKVCGK